MVSATTSLSTFPKDLLIEIFSRVGSPEEVCKVQRVCKLFLDTAKSPLVWNLLCTQYFPNYEKYLGDPQQIKKLFPKVAIIIEDEQGKKTFNYQLLFKQIVIWHTVRKGLLLYPLLSIRTNELEDCLEGLHVNIAKVRSELKSAIREINGKNFFQQELLYRAKTESIWTMIKCALRAKSSYDHDLRNYNYPALLLLSFDFFCYFNYIPKEDLDAWIQDEDFAHFEFNPYVDRYFLKGYLLWCILQSKDLTPFIEALKRNLQFIESQSDRAAIDVVSAVQALPEFVNAGLEWECNFMIYDRILEQFCGLKYYIYGLRFSHFYQCKGIDANLFSYSTAEPTPIIHLFLCYASFVCSPFERSFRLDPDVKAEADPSLQQYSSLIKGQFENEVELVTELETLLQVPDLNSPVKNKNGKTFAEVVNTFELPGNLKLEFIAKLEAWEQKSLVSK